MEVVVLRLDDRRDGDRRNLRERRPPRAIDTDRRQGRDLFPAQVEQDERLARRDEAVLVERHRHDDDHRRVDRHQQRDERNDEPPPAYSPKASCVRTEAHASTGCEQDAADEPRQTADLAMHVAKWTRVCGERWCGSARG